MKYSNRILSFLARTLLLAFFACVPATVMYAEDPVDFDRDIRPILSDKCFRCHGPDDSSRQAGLRLDVEEAAHETAFLPESLEDSEAWLRITSDDSDSIMPPPGSHKELDAAGKEQIKRWIQSGAKYQQHWSFRPVIEPEFPAIDRHRA